MIKDWRGTEIKIESRIVWPGRSGSHLWMTEGTVVDIIEEFCKSDPFMAYPIFKLKVKRTNKSSCVLRNFGKIVTISQFGRVTVLDDQWIDINLETECLL